MAGSEARGLAAAKIDLFDEAACLLTDDDAVGAPWAAALEDFWSQIGCRVHWLTAAEHDRLVARISHVPHLMAALTALIGFRNPADGALAGGGIRDTTRVAAGDPDMWAEILLENRAAVADALAPARESLAEILALLDRADQPGLRGWLSQARQLHAAAAEAKPPSTS
jgi:prephenate dehydrogenase